jgi:hypothetical protein
VYGEKGRGGDDRRESSIEEVGGYLVKYKAIECSTTFLRMLFQPGAIRLPVPPRLNDCVTVAHEDISRGQQASRYKMQEKDETKDKEQTA